MRQNNRRINAVVLVICVAMAFFIRETVKDVKESGSAISVMAMAFTEMAVPAVTASREITIPEPEQNQEIPIILSEVREDPPQENPVQKTDIDEGEAPTKSEDEPKPEGEEPGGLPRVLIYHTHATESYQPVKEGNFHSVEKTGTVREVGDAMAKRLEELGFEVIHDETIHDHPSYNQSYSRSLETAKGYLDKYPEISLVIDLHRDAAGYAGSVGKTVSVDGKNVASYGYVIGQGNPNVSSLTETVSDLNRLAEERYPDFTGKIIEKAYKFNQYISDHHVLVEVGNNENTIEQAKLTGHYLAEVFALYLKKQGM